MQYLAVWLEDVMVWSGLRERQAQSETEKLLCCNKSDYRHVEGKRPASQRCRHFILYSPLNKYYLLRATLHKIQLFSSATERSCG
jgi:hypothetical protein